MLQVMWEGLKFVLGNSGADGTSASNNTSPATVEVAGKGQTTSLDENDVKRFMSDQTISSIHQNKPLNAFTIASSDPEIREHLKTLYGIHPVNDSEWAGAHGSVTKWTDSDNSAYTVNMLSSHSGSAGWMKPEGDAIAILEVAEHQNIVKPCSFLLWNPLEASYSIMRQSGDISTERRTDYKIKAIVSPLVAGKPLSELISSKAKCTGIQLALDVGSDIIEALEHLQKKGIGCPDLKLENIIYQDKYKLVYSAPESSRSAFLRASYDKYAYPLSFGLLLLNLATSHDPYNYPIPAKGNIERENANLDRFVRMEWQGIEQYLKGLYPEKIKENPELFELIYKLMEMSDKGCNLVQANMRLHKMKSNNGWDTERSSQNTSGVS